MIYFFSFGLIDSYVGTTPITGVEWTDGISLFRLNVRNENLFLDEAITATGFSGTEGADYDSIWGVGLETKSTSWTDGVSTFRLDVRSSNIFLDQTKTPTGFSGVEGIDYDSIWSKILI